MSFRGSVCRHNNVSLAHARQAVAPLHIVVAVKSVIDVELNIRVREGQIVQEGLNYILSKWDENALEAALQPTR